MNLARCNVCNGWTPGHLPTCSHCGAPAIQPTWTQGAYAHRAQAPQGDVSISGIIIGLCFCCAVAGAVLYRWLLEHDPTSVPLGLGMFCRTGHCNVGTGTWVYGVDTFVELRNVATFLGFGGTLGVLLGLAARGAGR